jgi:hypothetical protein
MKLMEDWLGDRQDILPKARLPIDLLIMALEQVENLTRLSQNLAYLSQNEQLEAVSIRQLEMLIDAMNQARYRLQICKLNYIRAVKLKPTNLWTGARPENLKIVHPDPIAR